MKKTTLLLITLLSIVLLSSCKKDSPDDDVNYILDTDYFSVENATYEKASFPETSSNAPIIENITGNASVISGGSNPIVIQSNKNISNVFIAVKEIDGYYKLSASSNNSIVFYILMNQNLSDEEFEIMIATQDMDGNISERSYIAVSLVQAGTGRLQVSCSWDQLNDVDLHLVEPNGEEVFYGNGYSNNQGDLDLDSNAACSIDGVNNENITYDDNAVIENGEYIIRVDFYDNCNVTDPTNYNVIVYYEGNPISTTFGTNPYSSIFNPDEDDFGGVGDGIEVLRFQIPSTRTNVNSKTESLVKFKYLSNKTDKKVLSPQKL